MAELKLIYATRGTAQLTTNHPFSDRPDAFIVEMGEPKKWYPPHGKVRAKAHKR